MDERKANMSDDGLVNFAKMSKVLPLCYHFKSFLETFNLYLLKEKPIVLLMLVVFANICLIDYVSSFYLF